MTKWSLSKKYEIGSIFEKLICPTAMAQGCVDL